jgi:ubiquinone/menaquinone biosynthesis C-methylase UbiE
MLNQKTVFLESEGDAWLNRNHQGNKINYDPEKDRLLSELLELPLERGMKVLEIGCSSGYRLLWLQENLGLKCAGIEPSDQAVKIARDAGIDVYQGTAESLPFEDSSFDLVIFGFCLYLCDRTDLFRIAQETDRILKNPAWIMIMDFYSPYPIKRPYHHLSGIFTYKMDYRKLFVWHPDYTCLTHSVRHHIDNSYTDELQDWVAVSVIRKNSRDIVSDTDP